MEHLMMLIVVADMTLVICGFFTIFSLCFALCLFLLRNCLSLDLLPFLLIVLLVI